ncbi:MAG: type II secretion system protein [Verrucomicrobiia bacterium]
MKSVRQRRLATPKRNEAGFLLLEVLLAVFILAMSGFVLLEGLGRCVAAARSIQSYTVSDILLANKSYEYRQEPLKDNFSDQQGTFDDYPGYSWTRKLEGTDIEGLWQQTITVYWYERGKEVSDAVVEYRYLPDKEH